MLHTKNNNSIYFALLKKKCSYEANHIGKCILQLLIYLGLLVATVAHADTKKVSTALPNVLVLPEQLTIPGLQRQRQLRLYLPPDYANSRRRYPVLYMHDGQNLYDAATGYAGEWQVDETLNQLSRSGKLDLIVVGIDHGSEKRITELNPWNNAEFGAGEGVAYMDFLVSVVKPYIDQHYRTKADRQNTAIMGSSLGGLISHYAIARYPEVFSKAGIFSPSYWIAPEGFQFFAETALKKDARLYMLAGGKEGETQIPDVKRVYASVLDKGHPAQGVTLKIAPEGEHNEAFWSEEFAQAVLWMFVPDGRYDAVSDTASDSASGKP